MAVSNVHRFLYGEKSHSTGKRIWVLHGAHLQDWYYHNLLYGCVDIRRTLELWAFANGMQLTVTLTQDGLLDFSGNPNPAEAESIFEGARPRRRRKYGNRPEAATASNNAAQSGNQEENDAEARAHDSTEQAAGGPGRAILNTITKLTQIIKSTTIPTLVLIENFNFILRGLELDTRNAPIILNLINIVQNEWHKKISSKNLLVFFTDDRVHIEQILPAKMYPKVEWKETRRPSEAEILAAIERVATRQTVEFVGTASIGKILSTQQDTLELAMGKVLHLINSGEKEITVNKILELPPIIESELEKIKEEINKLVGLEEVKDKVMKLEKKARELRKQLEQGKSVLPEETMHMVFTGAPGTGKTMVARLVARLFHALGILKSDRVTEIIASTVMSSNIGETRENMQREIEKSRGGVLFIDEAHQFGDKDSLGAKEAIQALVPLSWNFRSEMVIILAGYADKMPDFYAMDAGLERRFPLHGRIMFHDYSLDELCEIFSRKLEVQGYKLDPTAQPRLRAILQRRKNRKSFGNAGGVDNLVNEILENHPTSTNSQSKTLTVADLPPLIRRDPKLVDEAFAVLDKMRGNDAVKERIKTIIARLSYELEEEERGHGSGTLNLHPGNMRFVGPSGTGKTTVARIMAKLLYGIGCIDKPVLVEVSPGELKGVVQGETEANVRMRIEQAKDGVFFIDEAYALVHGDQDTYGNQAKDELVAQMTKPENEGTVFILGGYKAEIDKFISTNSGLSRRFQQEIEFANFPPEDCMELARTLLKNSNFSWEDGVLERILDIAAEEIEKKQEQFGNAGWVEGIVKEILDKMKCRIIESKIPPDSPNRRQVMLVDLPNQGRDEVGTTQENRAGGLKPIVWNPMTQYCQLSASGLWQDDLPMTEIGNTIAASSYQIVTVEQDSDNKRSTGSATGFLVTPDGLMATSAHVVENVNDIKVLCGRNRTLRQAQLVRVNHDLDIALIAVDVDIPCPYLPLGDSMAIQPLSEMIVFGNAHVRPGEPGRLITARVVRNDNNNPVHIETDGAIEPGFSGGPAVDQNQKSVIGIVSGGYGPSATLFVRAEQLKAMLEDVGYRFV